jgi:enoyl-CoA hydratase/carnithine racemase
MSQAGSEIETADLGRGAPYFAASTLGVELTDHTLIVTMARPHRLNAFDATMRGELKELWQRVRDDDQVRVVVLTGEGRAFSSGADAGDLSAGIRSSADGDAADALNFLPAEWVDVPVIAAVNGLCSGGGLHFVADADLVIGSTLAWFNDPHVSVGQVSVLEPLTLLGRVSWSHVASMVLRGSRLRITAEEAMRQGFLDEVVEPEALLPRVLELAAEVAAQSPAAVRHSLRLLRRARRSLVQPLLDEGWQTIVQHWDHPDADEGPQAFMAKREPVWGPVEPSATAD